VTTVALTFLLVIATIAFFVVLGWDTIRRVFPDCRVRNWSWQPSAEQCDHDVALNLGIVGFLSFVFFVFQLFRQQDLIGGGFAIAKARMPLKGFVFGLLLIHSLSNPGFADGIMWIGFALALGAATESRSLYVFRNSPQSRSLAYASRNPFGGVTRRQPLSVDGSDHRTRGPSWRYPNSSSIRASGL
jgi:hypothetical protein